jgi:integrase
LDNGTALIEQSKTGRKRIILNEPALAILTGLRDRIPCGEYVFPGEGGKGRRFDLQKPWEATRRHARLEGVRLHDLRHSHASVGASAGASLHIVGSLLGHAKPETTRRYAHLADDARRQASEMIGRKIESAMRGKAAQIVELKKA